MRFNNLESYRIGGVGSDMQLGIPLPKTPDGRVYRHSPNENAHPRLFLLSLREQRSGAAPLVDLALTSFLVGRPQLLLIYFFVWKPRQRFNDTTRLGFL